MLKKVIKLLSVFFLCFFFGSIFSQNEVSPNLAFEYYKKMEYDKAADLFSSLYKSTKSLFYFNYYVYSLVQLSKYDDAKNFILNEYKVTKNLAIRIALSYVYRVINETQNYNKEVENILKKLPNSTPEIITIANQCYFFQDYNLAELIYLEARKNKKIDYKFYLELANVYRLQGKFDKMIDEYLYMLKEDPFNNLQIIQNNLQNVLETHRKTEMLNIIINRISYLLTKEYDPFLIEFLLWLYIQKRDFKNAYNIAVSIDKRNNENGKRLLEIGKLAFNNEEFEIASDFFLYVKSKGEKNYYYFEASSLHLLAIYYKSIRKKLKSVELEKINSLFLEFLNTYGINEQTYEIAINYAIFLSDYLDEKQKAITVLNKLLENKLSKEKILNVKLKLGEIYLKLGDFAEATILFTQIEQTKLDLPVVHEAKLKKSLLAFYSLDFDWCLAQLEVLKGSTSKFISNDAIYLASIINKFNDIDTSNSLLTIYAQFNYNLYKKDLENALKYLDSIKSIPFYYFQVWDIFYCDLGLYYYEEENYELSINYLDSLVKSNSENISITKALYYLALIYEKHLNNVEKALYYYEKIFLEHPSSYYSEEARRRFRYLKGETIKEEHEIYNHDFF